MNRSTLFQTCAAQSWAPQWGDADLYGVALTFLYAVAALFTVWVAVRLWQSRGADGRTLWTLAAVYLLALTVNKQLDLQTFLTQTARCVARAEGWYDARRTVQYILTLAVLAGMVLALGLTLRRVRRSWRGNGRMITGLVLITTFVALRVLSFHHMDTVLQLQLFGVPLHRFIETSSLLIIIWAAATKATPD